jgi:hypothetical protein
MLQAAVVLVAVGLLNFTSPTGVTCLVVAAACPCCSGGVQHHRSGGCGGRVPAATTRHSHGPVYDPVGEGQPAPGGGLWATSSTVATLEWNDV